MTASLPQDVVHISNSGHASSRGVGRHGGAPPGDNWLPYESSVLMAGPKCVIFHLI